MQMESLSWCLGQPVLPDGHRCDLTALPMASAEPHGPCTTASSLNA